MNDDLISRAAAIDILDAYQVMVENGEENPYAWARLRMSELPSAHPKSEERTEESAQNVPKEDLISRKAAIDAAESAFVRGVFPTAYIREIPSAQPEHMHTVMLKIKEKYEKAMNTPCINNPIAWALYQTWKEYDR